jgi:hypothetical protein
MKPKIAVFATALSIAALYAPQTRAQNAEVDALVIQTMGDALTIPPPIGNFSFPPGGPIDDLEILGPPLNCQITRGGDLLICHLTESSRGGTLDPAFTAQGAPYE